MPGGETTSAARAEGLFFPTTKLATSKPFVNVNNTFASKALASLHQVSARSC